MENKNHLGLDKFQLTIIKGNYSSIKPSLAKREKALKKIDEVTQKYKEKLEAAIASLKQEASAYDEQIAMIDKFTIETTQKACGIGLTTEQVMKFLEDPQAFENYKHQLGLDNDMFAQEAEQKAVRDLDAEEDAEWEQKIESGELKEVI